MNSELIAYLEQSNPWMKQPGQKIVDSIRLTGRLQLDWLLSPTWDDFWSILIGPRQAGKTTLGLLLCQQLLAQKRFGSLLYLNCDELLIRDWLKNPLFIQEAQSFFKIEKFILFIDEVQRLPSPGLLLKNIIDLKLPLKLIASGSSQLEIKSKVQEFLTGRQLEALILPFSYAELGAVREEQIIYGCYPKVVRTQDKALILQQLYNDYVNKDIIELLKVAYPDTLQKLMTLIAHSSGQLINYQQLATDLQSTTVILKKYLLLLEQTYTIVRIRPFVGNKRKEITQNPIYYFIDNGFRNQALRNFSALDTRQDLGLLIESAVFQELFKLRANHFLNFDIHFWRTQSGAEIDFILYVNTDKFIPIEVKYRSMQTAKLTRSFYSFIEAYQPALGFMITKDYYGKMEYKGCVVHLIPFSMLERALQEILCFVH